MTHTFSWKSLSTRSTLSCLITHKMFSLDTRTYICGELRRKIEHLAEGEYLFAERTGGPIWPTACVDSARGSRSKEITVRHLFPATHGPFPHMSQFTLSDLVPQIPIWTANEWNPRYLFERWMNETKNFMAIT